MTAGKSVRMLGKGQKLAACKILSADWLKVAQLIKYSPSQEVVSLQAFHCYR